MDPNRSKLDHISGQHKIKGQNTYLESSTPTISKIMSSNIVHEREKVVENMSWTKVWCTS